MFYNFKDQILVSTETGTEYRFCQYFFHKVPTIVPSVLFWISISRYRWYFKSTECPSLGAGQAL